ncbi:hypothetical protein PQX77_011804 [Marasmius sp. AFHP31]|nr:hypothetical protein PQX77_011804 [Marasmius sp. AFHP31]
MSSADNDEFYMTTAYLRVASLAIAGYSFIETAPSVWKFYRDQLRLGRVTISLVMLILVQLSTSRSYARNYILKYNGTLDLKLWLFLLAFHHGILSALLSPSIGLQSPPGHGFPDDLGNQSVQSINPVKTYWNDTDIFICIDKRDRMVGHILQENTNLVGTSSLTTFVTSCRGRFDSESVPMNAWVYYVAAIIYDLGVTVISVGYLLKHKHTTVSHSMLSRITRMMLYDGIGYFVFLTGVNVVNLIIYRQKSDIQTAGASLGYAATWIFTQRLLIHLHEMSLERRNESMYEAYTISQTISSAQAVNRAVRSQFEPKGSLHDSLELTNPDFDLDTMEAGLTRDSSDDVSSVKVRVEKTVTIQRRPSTKKELEDYSRHAVSTVTNATTDGTRTISVVSTGKKR